MQPLDVGIFGPMKSAWRAQLSKYADKDPAAKLLLKTEFPKMLKELLLSLNPKQHLPAAFEKCGLVPLNRNKVLERIPSVKDTHTIARILDASLLKKLEVRRFGDQSRKKPRGKKVPAGQSYSREEAKSSGEEDSEGEDSVGEDSEQENSEQEDSEQENSSNSFTWGSKPDIMLTLNEDIILEDIDMIPINPFYPTQHDRVSYKKRYIMQNIYLICLSLIGVGSSDTQLLFFTKKLPA
jgi:hypothetical protein